MPLLHERQQQQWLEESLYQMFTFKLSMFFCFFYEASLYHTKEARALLYWKPGLCSQSEDQFHADADSV